MKVVLIAPQNSIHVARWANALVKKVDELHLVTLHKSVHQIDAGVVVHKLKFKSSLGYVLNKYDIQKKIDQIQPDIIHVHQCSGHGTMVALTNIKTYLLSIYGSDIYEFPKRNIITKKIIEYNLSRSKYLASTSFVMANEAKKYTDKKIYITPFGVDTKKFFNQRSPELNNNTIHIGLVKSLRKKYGIDFLIKAIPILNSKLRNNGIEKKIELTIYGKGELLQELIKTVQMLNLKNISFPGYIPNEDVPSILNTFDIVCIPSIADSESFGVSAVESMACERPLVVSDADGLKEVVEQNVSGIIVPRKNPNAIAEALFALITNENYARKLGSNGRQRVLNLYNWDKNVDNMLDIYKEIIASTT